MTEQEWLAGSEPERMLKFVFDRAGPRRLRLFGCACSRRVWNLLDDGCFREAIEVAERFADGLASSKELAAARKVSGAMLSETTGQLANRVRGCAWSTTRMPVGSAAMYPLWVLDEEADRNYQVAVLRDLFGNPFRPAAIDPAWLAWQDRTIARLAQAAYDERELPGGKLDGKRLAIMADALEEAGCASADILGHLRGPGPHVRGCWVVDLLLKKE